jgi:hypothetical protein
MLTFQEPTRLLFAETEVVITEYFSNQEIKYEFNNSRIKALDSQNSLRRLARGIFARGRSKFPRNWIFSMLIHSTVIDRYSKFI